MKRIEILALAGKIFLTTGLLAGAAALHADTLPASTYDTAVQNARIAGPGAAHATPLREALSSTSAVRAIPAALGSSSLLGLSSSSPAGSNPYLLFADVLAMSYTGNQPAVASRVLSFDATNSLPAAGPVPLPASIWLLLSGLAAIVVHGRKRGMGVS